MKLQNQNIMGRQHKFTAYLVGDKKCEFKEVWANSQADAMNKIYETIAPDVQIKFIREA